MAERRRGGDLKVLVATPLGLGGKGGIDRIMDSVRGALAETPRAGLDVAFAETRGKGSILLSPLVLAAFIARMAAVRPDVVHINLSSHGSTRRKLIVARAAALLGIPTVIHLHGSRFRQYWAGASARTDRAIVRMFEGAARVLVLGEVWRAFVGARAPGAKIAVLPNATPQPALAPVTGEPGVARLLFIGRLGARKGVPELVAALGQLKDLPGWRAIIAGDGEIGDTRAAVERLGLVERVAVPGWAGPAEVAAMIAASDVLVLPSYDENLPMSVIEGMAAGLAIVATPVGAVEDIVTDGETGLLVQPGDVDGLAAALRRLIEDPALRARLGAAGRAVHRERLDIAPYVDRLVAIWREAAR